MANLSMTPPPSSGRGGLRQPVVKPRDLTGTLKRLWTITKGSRKGLGWILFFSALASASSILSPYVIGSAISAIASSNPILSASCCCLSGCTSATGWYAFCSNLSWPKQVQRMIHHIRFTLFRAMEIYRCHF